MSTQHGDRRSVHRLVDDADVSVFGFGPAGTWPAWWAGFAARLPNDWTVISAVLPGRAQRLDVPPLTSVEEQAEDVLAWLEAEVVNYRAVHLLGVCSGALLAYEAGRGLRKAGVCARVHMVNPPPPDGVRDVSTLRDAELIDRLRREALLPDALAVDPSLTEMFIPALQGDIAAAESYTADSDDCESAEVTFYCSPDDTNVRSAWEARGIVIDRQIPLIATEREVVDEPERHLARLLELEIRKNPG